MSEHWDQGTDDDRFGRFMDSWLVVCVFVLVLLGAAVAEMLRVEPAAPPAPLPPAAEVVQPPVRRG